MGNMVAISVSLNHISTLNPEDCADDLIHMMNRHSNGRSFERESSFGMVASPACHDSHGETFLFHNNGFSKTKTRNTKTPFGFAKGTPISPSMVDSGGFLLCGFLTDNYHNIDFEKAFTSLQNDIHSLGRVDCYETGDQFDTGKRDTDKFPNRNGIQVIGAFKPNQSALVSLYGNLFIVSVQDNTLSRSESHKTGDTEII